MSAIQAEKAWRKSTGKVLTQRHCFPHRLIRQELSNVLVGLGCQNHSIVLDIGCGSGEDSQYIGKVSRDITGVDISEEALRGFRTKGYRGIKADARDLPFMSGSFEYVVCPAVLHHLIGQGDLLEYLRELVRVLQPGGYLVVLEPNCFNISGFLMNIANTLKPGITGLVPHERALSPMVLINTFRKAGLTNVNCIAASYTWNRFPLWLSKLIAKHESQIRDKTPFRYLGWFSIISGQKGV